MNLEMKCDKCEQVSIPILEKAGPHIKASCGACGRYIRFISPKTDARLRLYLAQEGVVHDEYNSRKPGGALRYRGNKTEE